MQAKAEAFLVVHSGVEPEFAVYQTAVVTLGPMYYIFYVPTCLIIISVQPVLSLNLFISC